MILMMLLWLCLKNKPTTFTAQELEDILLLIHMLGEDLPPSMAQYLKQKIEKLLND